MKKNEDPVDVNRVTYFKEKAAPEENMDWYSLLGLVFGIMAVMFEIKWAAWAGIFAIMAAFANLKASESDGKQMFANVMFVVMGLVKTYLAKKRVILEEN